MKKDIPVRARKPGKYHLTQQDKEIYKEFCCKWRNTVQCVHISCKQGSEWTCSASSEISILRRRKF